uniref:NADH:ubiquinone oxidoreductase 30kDa subunit domain-containing protein n=1 Tax=Eutreptiella gymnastica TaxID=73025 RepID=A0A7S1J460_9EUGL|mmetsp:Transcript_64696/g.115057  ORF Transcript_64696/g.115057 Transcript_64696/m.115057 type:complete len:285 (+) Transcript_64696:44-898(+)
MLRGVARRCALAALRPTAGAAKAVCQASSTRTYAGKYSSTTEVPPVYEKEVKNTPQDPNKEEFVRYMASILHPMASEITWDDQTNDVTIHIYPQFVRPVLKILRDHQQFQYKCLADMTCVDTMSNKRRFDVVYCLLSIVYRHRVMIRTSVDDASGIDSVTPLFHSAVWAEREAWDMFGVFFIGHPDLRRMLSDYGFEGHPLRKDFPLGGYTEVYWDAASNIIKYASPPVFREEYRDYENIETEWEDLYHRCNTAWAYDNMVNKGMESCDKDFTYDDPAVHKKAA